MHTVSLPAIMSRCSFINVRVVSLSRVVRRSALRAAPTTRRTISTSCPSSIDSGFILSLPKLPNPATSDPAFQRVLSWYLPPTTLSRIQPQLTAFGEEAVSDRVNTWISNAERQPPYVKTRNIWGEKYERDRLVTSEGWKQLGRWGIENGVVAAGYEKDFGEYRRIVQHAL